MLLNTGRLIVRPFDEKDVDEFADLMKHEEVMRFSLHGALSKQQAKDYLENRIFSSYSQYGYGLWALQLKSNNRLIGYAGLLNQIIEQKQEVELGYRLHPDFWGQGLAKEAALAIYNYAFNQLGVDHLISIIDPENRRSLNLAKRIGMHFWKKSRFHGHEVCIFSLDKVILWPFDSSWSQSYAEEKIRLENAFKEEEIDFYHIGSTAITGCAAKPIIDILGVTSDVLSIDKYNSELETLGYEVKGEWGIPQRRFFIRRGPLSINLHIFENSDPEVERHLRFSYYLNQHPKLVKEYSELKQELAREFSYDRYKYTGGKENFIKSIDIQAAWEINKPLGLERSWVKRQSWPLEEIKKAMLVNMRLHMTYFAKYVPEMEFVFEPDVTVVRTCIQDDTFNYVLQARFSQENAQRRIEHILNLFKNKQLPFSWWVGEDDEPSNLREFLEKNGLKYKEENCGMYLMLPNRPFSLSASSPLMNRVENSTQLNHFYTVITKIGFPVQAFEILYSKIPPVLYTADASMEMHVGYIDHEPVVSGIVLFHANVAGIYYVATIPEQRKNGFGTTMMQHLLNRAVAKGYKVATLQASSQGKSLYERLGFQSCYSIKEYSLS